MEENKSYFLKILNYEAIEAHAYEHTSLGLLQQTQDIANTNEPR